MVNEIILTVLFILAGVSVLISLCAGAAKIGGIFAGVSRTLDSRSLIFSPIQLVGSIMMLMLEFQPNYTPSKNRYLAS